MRIRSGRIEAMSSKFSSCTLGQLYRRVGKDEHVLGGPMVYLEEGLKERLAGLGKAAPVIGKIFAVMFALFTITGSIGGGNMFQGNQTFSIVSQIAGIHQAVVVAAGDLPRVCPVGTPVTEPVDQGTVGRHDDVVRAG